MLSEERNRILTQVGKGTPFGELLRRYWYPVAFTADLLDFPVKRTRLLGQDLVVFRLEDGTVGLLDEQCPHRRASLAYGVAEPEGLRCGYHGWLFDTEGRCLEQPAEPADSTFRDRIQTGAYPAQEMGGLVWGYLGPTPVPLVPQAPRRVPAAPVPAPSAPVDAPVATGTVLVEGDAAVSLVLEGAKAEQAPGSLRAGSYSVLVRFMGAEEPARRRR